MSYNDDIIRSIRKIAQSTKTDGLNLICKVIKVNVSDLTCDVEPLDGGADILNVKLVTGDSGMVLIPTEDSIVYVSVIDNEHAFVSMVGAISDVKIYATTNIEMYGSSLIKINGDSYGGLVKVDDLVTKLNDLENKLNDLINACSSQIVTLAPSGTFPLASFFTSVTPLPNTTAADLESDETKHGDGNP